MNRFLRYLLTLILFISISCGNTYHKKAINDQTQSLDWLHSAVIYEVNIRQYTPEGTFQAFLPHLDRLDSMGVDILWLMPVHPISRTKRKGSLGSYYSVDNYTEINPNFGTKTDFREVVKKAHKKGMKVILDWVANHTGWDHPWIKEHPEWYTKNQRGEITDPLDPSSGKSIGWTDVADLNYDNKALRKAMIEEMMYWVREFDIDGYRCDIAHFVPDDFWQEAVDSLQRIKQVFMLAESERPELRNKEIFHATYGWDLMHLTNQIATSHAKANDIIDYYTKDTARYEHGFHMYFTTNHDENSWNGTVFERLGEGHLVFATLVNTLPGMPLLYSGQEEPLRKRLSFFEKDTIPFRDYAYVDFYAKFFHLKEKNKALWHGEKEGTLTFISTGNQQTLAYLRRQDSDCVLVMLNLSDQPQEINIEPQTDLPAMQEIFTGQPFSPKGVKNKTLTPWAYQVFATDESH